MEWEEHFYEGTWEPDTLTLTEAEERWMAEVTRFLPRHMMPYDWNLPFAEMILLITRRHLLTPEQPE